MVVFAASPKILMLHAQWRNRRGGGRGAECSGVARAFPSGRLAHPEGQIEEENK